MRKRQGDVRQKVAGKRDAAPFPSDEEITSYPRQEGVPYGSGHDIPEKITGRRPSCQSALVMGGKLYSVKIKLDVATGTERLQRQIQEDVRCKDHTLAEREIASVQDRGVSQKGQPAQGTDAASEISLGAVRGNVKPPRPEANGKTAFFPRDDRPQDAGCEALPTEKALDKRSGIKNPSSQGGAAFPHTVDDAAASPFAAPRLSTVQRGTDGEKNTDCKRCRQGGGQQGQFHNRNAAAMPM